MAERSPGGEADIIRRYFAPLAEGVEGAYGLKDDAGDLKAPAGHEIVLTTDMVVAGVHYLESTAPQDVAYKALAVNVSDLCAKGAEPAVYLLSVAFSETPDPKWLDGLSEGFAQAQQDFRCGLLGGDTVHSLGPVVIAVTAAGFVPEGRMVHRFGAKVGDLVYVTGTIGDGALGLAVLRGQGVEVLTPDQQEFLKNRYLRPCPRLDAISLVRDHANASMDISDGVAGDFVKMCDASEVGGRIRAGDVPLSEAAQAWAGKEPDRLLDALTGGDDYELLLAVPEGKKAAFERDCAASGVQAAPIGLICAPGDGVTVIGTDGRPLYLERAGYDHFRG